MLWFFFKCKEEIGIFFCFCYTHKKTPENTQVDWMLKFMLVDIVDNDIPYLIYSHEISDTGIMNNN